MNQNEIIEFQNNSILDLNLERQKWNKFIYNKLIFKPIECPLCKYHSISIVENDSIYNIFIARYSSSNCRRKIFLRQNTFFAHFHLTQVSILLYIIKLLINDNKNATQISTTLKDKIANFNFSYNNITNIIEKFLFYIAHYIRDQYNLETISELNKNQNLAID